MRDDTRCSLLLELQERMISTRRTSMRESTLSPISAPIGAKLQTHNQLGRRTYGHTRRLLCFAKRKPFVTRTILGPAESTALRETLLLDLDQLQSADEAADWVHKNLAAKNTLITSDAAALEAGFREKLATIEGAPATRNERLHSAPGESPEPAAGKPFETAIEGAVAVAPPVTSDTSASRRRVATKTIRLRDKEHCKYVATQSCVVCGRVPSEAHHIRFAQPRALGRKVSDEYTVPVCRLHHRDLHTYGDEASWWASVSLDPLPIALELWRRSRLTYSLRATHSEPLSDADSPRPEKVERPSSDQDATLLRKSNSEPNTETGVAFSEIQPAEAMTLFPYALMTSGRDPY
jgi:hypothetical protein